MLKIVEVQDRMFFIMVRRSRSAISSSSIAVVDTAKPYVNVDSE
jgi:hypothetical protein